MELRHLRYFRAVAELLNFSRAAERLRIAQPALSRQIRALEQDLGTPLFVRDRGVRLTDAGRVFYTHTCKILAHVDLATAAAQEAASGTGGELIVCSDWRVSGQFLPAAVAEFHRKFPRSEVTLRDLRYHDQLTALRSRRAHLGFIVRTVLGRARELETLLVLRARLVVVLPVRHPRADDDLLQVSDLATESWVVLDEKEAPGYRTFLTQLCRLSGFTPKIGHAASTPEGLIGRVASGFGVALALDLAAPHHNQLVRVRSLDVEPLELCAVWHRRETSPLLAAFIDIVREQAALNLAAASTALPPKSAKPAPKTKRVRSA
ncbi:MAG: LysR substrate-binding domain-containing protein [Verrucomicrobiota bacterium]